METLRQTQDDKTQNDVKLTLFDWLGRAFIGLIVFFAYNIYTDVKTLVSVVPVMQERIQTLEKKVERIENKIFTDAPFQYPIKKEDEVSVDAKK